MSKNNIHIIGLPTGQIPSIPNECKHEIENCDILIGAPRLLTHIENDSARRVPITKDLPVILNLIRNNKDKKIVILSSGDPNLYGVSDIILRNFPQENIVITPHISAMQLAFAKSKISMNGAYILSAHGREISNIIQSVMRYNKVGIFTSNSETPVQIAKLIKQETPYTFDVYLCEDIGFETEQIRKTDLDSLGTMTISPLNILILVKKPNGEGDNEKNEQSLKTVAPVIGMDESEFYHLQGMITKPEVRAIDLAKLTLKSDHTLWDIGAGCGSVSIEAASLVYGGCVYAIEKDGYQVDCIKKNCEKFNRSNITIIHNEAPQGLYDLPSPDRIFIGGSGGKVTQILQVCTSKIKTDGKIILNLITLPTLIQSITALEEMNYSVEVLTVNISKTEKIKTAQIFKAKNPVYIVLAQKNR